jgi:hypothetical protein
MKIRAIFALCAIAFLVVSCATQRDPRLLSAIRATSVAEIRIDAAPEVYPTRTTPDGKTPEVQLGEVTAALHTALARDVKGYPGGATQARLVVTLHRVYVASKAGRILAAAGSQINGTVRLEDIKTGKLIAEAQDIKGEDKPPAPQVGLIGLASAAVVNAVIYGRSDLTVRLSDAFSQQVKIWLTPK